MGNHKNRTHLHAFHVKNGKMISFAGFEMPIWYKGIIPEHLAVRNSIGIFDVGHMGRAVITGPEAEEFLNFVTTNNVSTLEPFSAQYSTICNKRGGIKDDFVLSQQERGNFFMVYNAANRKKNYQWLTKNATRFKVEIEDLSDNISMFAVQGPRAQETLQKITTEDLGKIERFKCGWIKLAGLKTFISRTGYTGEDGYEIFIWDTPVSASEKAEKAWNAIIKAGKEFHIEPCGLGARDTLRLEAGMCLYGNDLDENTTPLEARIGFVVKFQKEEFIGKEALQKQKVEGIKKKRIGLKMLDTGIPRPKHEISKKGEKIGYVTSGTFSPLLRQGIAMAYIHPESAVTDNTLLVKIRDKHVRAEITRFPFYDPDRYGYKRK
ncbi:MAG: glycine cleavage system aminomethyltransferase GcvT [Candidatus Bathyarchaeota archaeon]|nr:MAG: glycine cleavage system aminomethyltransferase GcvT [Candidatus Bathyarchaeota archaeon]